MLVDAHSCAFRGGGIDLDFATKKATAMDRETFTETIRAHKHRTPFQPFTVTTVGGNRYEVDYPDALAVRDGLAIFVGPGRVPVFFDHEGVSDFIGDLASRRADAG